MRLTGIHGTEDGGAVAQIIAPNVDNESTWFAVGQNPTGQDGYEIADIDLLNCVVHFKNGSSIKLHQGG